MPTDGETLKEEDEFIGFEYFIIKHTFQTKFNPYEVLIETLDGERYVPIIH